MDHIKLALDRLPALSEGEIADLEGQILTEFGRIEKETPTRESVDSMTALADALDAVRGETTRRNDETAELGRLAAEAASRVNTMADATKPEDDPLLNPDGTPVTDASGVPVVDPNQAAVGDVGGPADIAPGAPVPAPADAVPADPNAPAPAPDSPAADAIAADVAASDAAAADAAAAEADAAAGDGSAADAETPADETDPNDEPDKKKTAYAVDGSEAVSEPEPVAASAATPSTTPATDTDAETIVSNQESEGAVTASASSGGPVVVTAPAGNRPVPTADLTGIGLTIRAGADVPGFGAGQQLKNMDEVAQAFTKRLHTLRNVQGGIGEQHTVATLAFDFPEDRRFNADDQTNIERLHRVEALTAAAGICAPLETLYDINICGVTDRPVRDSLTRFNADRGGVRMYPAPTLNAACTAGFWNTTATNHGYTIAGAPVAGYGSNPASTTSIKGCCDAVCSDPTEVVLDAIYACMKFSNFTSRFFPEIVKANTDLALINQARVAEQTLLAGIAAYSIKTTVTAGATSTGITRQVIRTIRQAAVGVRRRHRLAVNTTMRTILPSWLLDAMVADIALQMPGDGLESLSISEATLRGLFSDANVNVTWALDEVDAAGAPVPASTQAAGALNDFPDIISFPIFPEGSFVYLDGGTLDLGVVRDTTTIGTNEYATFVETFEGVAFNGCESLWVTLDGVCVSGAAAALVDTACA